MTRTVERSAAYQATRQRKPHSVHTGIRKDTYLIVRRDLHREKQRFIIQLFAVILCTMFFLVGMVCAIRSDAGDDSTPRIKYYTSVKIESGDSLWALSEQFYSKDYHDKSAYIAEVRHLNHMDDDQIQEGAYVVFPYYDTKVKE